MAAAHDDPQGKPDVLGTLLETASHQSGKTTAQDAMLFSGNHQESVPRALFFDRRLTPLERNAWQVLRLLLNPDDITVFPTYERLRPCLAAMPCTGKASHETVARALTLLRLTRWLSLVRRRRNPRTGRIEGNLYVLHDTSLTPFEAIHLDAGYLQLVSQSLTHASKAIQRVASATLRELADDPQVSQRALPTRLQVITEQLTNPTEDAPAGYPQPDPGHPSEEGLSAPLRNDEEQSSDSEAGPQTSDTDGLRNPKAARTVRSNHHSIHKVLTVRELCKNLVVPDYFSTLRDEQQRGALSALRQVDVQLQQAVLDEWTVRCLSGDVRNPAGYLFGIIQKAIRGEFNTWVGDLLADARSPSGHRPGDERTVEEHCAHLRSLFKP
ncbi:MAG: STY4528 family pathogenicity island replication protein [Parahaliea sp.]